MGVSATNHPATIPCDRCPNSCGEVWEDTLTEQEINASKVLRFERDDNP